MFKHPLLPLHASCPSEVEPHQTVLCVCTEHIVPRSRTSSVILTAAVSLLITAVQTVVVSITLPQGPDAALVVALELVVSAGPWL